jgi:hypothetical protein
MLGFCTGGADDRITRKRRQEIERQRKRAATLGEGAEKGSEKEVICGRKFATGIARYPFDWCVCACCMRCVRCARVWCVRVMRACVVRA